MSGTVEYEDPATPGSGGTVPMFALAGNDDELLVEKNRKEAAWIAGLPPGWVSAFYWDEPFTLYFLLDKPSLMLIFGTQFGFGESFILDSINNAPPLWNTERNPEKSPRETWHGNEWELD